MLASLARALIYHGKLKLTLKMQYKSNTTIRKIIACISIHFDVTQECLSQSCLSEILENMSESFLSKVVFLEIFLPKVSDFKVRS